MFLKINDPAVRLRGRWHMGEDTAIATAVGSMLEVAFTGKAAVLRFNMNGNEPPYPHVWITVDGGVKTEAALDAALRVEALNDGAHVVTVIFKSAAETQSRWSQPLVGKVEFAGAEVEKAAVLPQDDREIIEFIGDSITEGIAIAPYYGNAPCIHDVTGTYAWLTAQNLGMQPVIAAYGGVGVTAWGCGGVPTSPEIYPYNFADSPAHIRASVVVINHGANDKNWKRTAEEYVGAYTQLLKTIRAHNPTAKIVVLSAFCGMLPAELKAGIEDFNRENGDEVYFIDSAGWIPEQPLHPLYDGHKTVAEHLTEELRRIL